MVQGTTSRGLYHSYSKTRGDVLHGKERCSYFIGLRERLSLKWKVLTTAGVIVVLIFIFTGITMYLDWRPAECRRGLFNVHIVPYMQSEFNSYRSPEEYFNREVRQTLTFVVDSLEKNRAHRYTIPEMHFFWKWWNNQNETMKKRVVALMKDGQLEVAGGGWVVPDEATVHYTDFIDQFSWGLRCLGEMYGESIGPDVCLMMDNRGHSNEIASILRRMEVRGIILGGVSPSEQCYRRFYRKMEFFWSENGPFGIPSDEPDVITSLLDDGTVKLSSYFARDGPAIDLDHFLQELISHAFGYASNNVLIPVGQRFRIEDTRNMFNVIDSVINLTKSGTSSVVNVMYSTPSIYLSSGEYDDERWFKSSADFLPFVTSKFEYWTGYYSSRPSLRYRERVASLFLKVLKQVLSLSGSAGEYSDELTELRESVALCQHHNAVAGVSREKIADYFSRLLHNRMSRSVDAASHVIDKVTSGTGDGSGLRYESCLRLNVSECSVTEKSEKFIITVYNPSTRYVNQYVRVPVTRDRYRVVTSDGTSIPAQLAVISGSILSMPGRRSRATKELIFRATRIPALGFKSYYVSVEDIDRNATEDIENNIKAITLLMNATTGKLSHLERNGESYAISQEILFYASWLSSNSVFKPDTGPQSMGRGVATRILNDGPHVTEYQQIFGPWATQIITVYKDEDFIEFKWIVGPVLVSSFEGKEVITSFQTNIKNSDNFYVDANGRGMKQKRKCLPQQNETLAETIPKIYRPVTSHIAIADHSTQLHVFNDRCQGGTTAFDGEIQLMIHRRLPNPNTADKGVDLDERSYGGGLVVTGRHWVFLGSAHDSRLKRSIEEFAMRSHWEPWYFFADASSLPYDEWKTNHVTEFSGLRKQLPRNVRILTLEPWKDNKILLRLENTGLDACSEVRLDLQEMFSKFAIVTATEVSLAGNGFKKPVPYPQVKFQSFTKMKSQERTKMGNCFIFVFPGEIKTLLLDVKPIA